MKIDRLMGIITTLLNKEKVTAPFLAGKFEVSVRTINRDILDLCKAGIPIVTTRGAGGGIYLDPDFKMDKSLLKEDEINAIYAGLKGITSISDNNKYELLLDKFKDNPKNDLDIDLSSYYKKSLSDKIEKMQKAINNKLLLEFDYFSKKGKSHRVVEPYTLTFKWSSWYLYAYSLEREDFRLFKLNRSINLKETGETFLSREIPLQENDIDKIYPNDLNVLIIFDKDVDLIQVGARNMQNFDLLKELGNTKKPVLLKRGLSSTIEEWLMSAEYILA
ncbi:helix-turn-helix transcriptional regulator, partial [Anaerofustis stercorihominis]|uniref:helix-turn-helix transcriptional regulator n=1 Tax=Anaerofustis stercorihominis TaxID=214853 RepID=UPI0026727910